MKFLTLALATIALGLVGCTSSGGGSSSPTASVGTPSAIGGSLSPTASPSVSGSPTASASPLPALSGPCANVYFPVVNGATWRYLRTAVGRHTPIRQSFESISDGGFTVLQLLPDGGERDVWTCSSAGLASLEQYTTGPGGGPPPAGTTQFHGFRSVGVTVPATIQVGDAWKQVVTSSTRFAVAGTSYPERQVVTTSYRAAGLESVSTPAGVFDAMKVMVRSLTHKTAPTFGEGINLHTTSLSTEWWVAGIGVVRRIIDTGSGYPTTIELVRYRIPGEG